MQDRYAGDIGDFSRLGLVAAFGMQWKTTLP